MRDHAGAFTLAQGDAGVGLVLHATDGDGGGPEFVPLLLAQLLPIEIGVDHRGEHVVEGLQDAFLADASRAGQGLLVPLHRPLPGGDPLIVAAAAQDVQGIGELHLLGRARGIGGFHAGDLG